MAETRPWRRVYICVPGHSVDASVSQRSYSRRGSFRTAIHRRCLPRDCMRATRSVRVRRAVCMPGLGMRVTLSLLLLWLGCLGRVREGLRPGRVGRCSWGSVASWPGRALRSPGCSGAYHILNPLSTGRRGESVAVMNLPSGVGRVDSQQQAMVVDIDLACEITEATENGHWQSRPG